MVYWWLGLCAVLVCPSPKFHDHDVMGDDPADEVSVNCTVRLGAAQHDRGVAVKLAVGGAFDVM